MELIYECQNRKNSVVFHVNFCFPILSFGGFLILLFLICFFRHFVIPISVDYQYVTSNQQDLKKKITETNISKTKEAQKPVITTPGINTPDPSKPSPSKNDVDEFLDKIHSYKKENKVVDRKWLNDLINKYNADFSEDFSQYLSLSKDIILS